MPQYEFPHAYAGDEQKEKFIRDIEFLNYHINHDKWAWYRIFHIAFAHRLELDFCCFDSDCWTITTTEEGSGSATEGCIDAVNGVLQIVNAGGLNDMDELVYGCECFQLVDNFPLYAEIRFKVDDPDAASFWFGLITGNQWFTPPNDYVVFYIPAADDSIYFGNAVNGGATDTDTGRDLPDDEWYRLGFLWDGEERLRYFVFDERSGYEMQGGYCIATGIVTTHICQDEVMNLGFGLRNDEADAHSMDIDYVYCVQKRVIE
jgi:hypothetical protein